MEKVHGNFMADSDGLHIDDALTAVGGWGRFQKIVLFVSFVAAIPNAFMGMPMAITQYEPEHHCAYPTDFFNYTTKNTTERLSIISTIIPQKEDDQNQWDQCKMYDRNFTEYPVEDWPEQFSVNNNTKIINCLYGMSYDLPAKEENVIMEFDMVCSNDWKAHVSASLHHLGLLVGSFSVMTADWYGRRPLFIVAVVGQIISQVLCAVSWNFESYCFTILLGGVFALINYVVSFVLVTEITEPKWINFTTIACFLAFSLGYCITAFIGYCLPQWRWFTGAMATVSFCLYAPCCWYFPESPRWLAQKGRSEGAIKNLKLIAKVNKREKYLREALEDGKNRIVSKNNVTRTGILESMRVLFKSGIAIRYCTLVYGWIISSTVYYAIALYSTNFSDDRFLNMFLAGVAEIPAILLACVLVKYLGRPRTTLLLMSLCSISSLTLPFIGKESTTFKTAVAMIGKGSVAGVFYVWYLMSSEAVPTLQRSSAMSVCSAMGRVGSFAAPYMMYLGKSSQMAPNLIMGVGALVSGLTCIFFVPETLGVTVPDTVEEARGNRRIYGIKLLRTFTDETTTTSKKETAVNDESHRML